jgi:unsaturated rhamnogalacturonyl hydrolase
MFLISILCFLGFLAVTVIAVDALQMFHTWLGRIHIGRWNDRWTWQKAVESKCKSWLKHTPVIPVSDNDTYILFKKKRGVYEHDRIQSWQLAGLLMGLDDNYAKTFITSHRNIENVSVDYAFLLYILFKKHAISLPELRSFAKKLGIDSSDTTIPYNNSLPDVRFVDAIGMIVPFLYACGYRDKALMQLKEYDEGLLNGVFPPHAYDKQKHLPMGVFDWSRGIGWYILGITETIELDSNYLRVIRLADELLSFQRKDGGFGCMLFSNSHLESTGTALIGTLFVKAFELTKKDVYFNAAISAEKALMRITRRNGEVDFAQGDTKGIGSYSLIFNTMPFAQGMALYLSKQISCLILDSEKNHSCCH